VRSIRPHSQTSPVGLQHYVRGINTSDQPQLVHKLPSMSPPSTASPKSTRNSTPFLHIVSNLPHPADHDLAEIPRPTDAPEDISHREELLVIFLPPELVDVIVDLVEYWPCAAISHNSFRSALEAPDMNAEWCFLVSPDIRSLERSKDSPLPMLVEMMKFLIKAYTSARGGQREVSKSKPAIFSAC